MSTNIFGKRGDDETFSEAVERMEAAVEEYGKRGMYHRSNHGSVTQSQ
jgi:predicted amidohydrolase YtcJ